MAAISLAQLGHEGGQDAAAAAAGGGGMDHQQQQLNADAQHVSMGVPVVSATEQYMLPMAGVQ
jgi:hypothetical protein